MKSTPTEPAASSIARASGMSSSDVRARPATSEAGVIEMRLFAMRSPNSSPISLTTGTRRAAVRSIFSRTASAVSRMEARTQSRSDRPSVTVRTSRCSISVMRTVCKISAWVYSILARGGLPEDGRAQEEEEEEEHEQHRGHDDEAQARIVRRLFERDERVVAHPPDPLSRAFAHARDATAHVVRGDTRVIADARNTDSALNVSRVRKVARVRNVARVRRSRRTRRAAVARARRDWRRRSLL